MRLDGSERHSIEVRALETLDGTISFMKAMTRRSSSSRRNRLVRTESHSVGRPFQVSITWSCAVERWKPPPTT